MTSGDRPLCKKNGFESRIASCPGRSGFDTLFKQQHFCHEIPHQVASAMECGGAQATRAPD
jgi:hypothetical protein